MKSSCHKPLIPNLNRISGQINGVARMVDEGQYCIDILDQLRAAKSAITTVENKILEKHIQECVTVSLQSQNDVDTKIQELMRILKRK
ncbi:MAG: metal-sensitive transcriptional regulator [Porticoccaceae bacterium]|jgi:DNA-binding FrmR family transcriptional regulator|nr:metal-sensitive transcriptional regulator [Porticoccaceae bacterium]MBT4213962.1 metal-sensitive transcriptional regulator [Porticoccaceae bacterium]MBT5070780.1 metal-sensitive transcriptional regulator [Porticoccaceae bacterium]MBT7564818.1 metal-sensitive transcriptional regulator [Porticoccaceae bacterium]MBT7946754.1 metal-sensitive transcriptional regulator [Porticoccaceae bacterium]